MVPSGEGAAMTGKFTWKAPGERTRLVPPVLFALLLGLSLSLFATRLLMDHAARRMTPEGRTTEEAGSEEERSYVEAHVVPGEVAILGLLVSLALCAAISWLVFKKTTVPSPAILLIGLLLLAVTVLWLSAPRAG